MIMTATRSSGVRPRSRPVRTAPRSSRSSRPWTGSPATWISPGWTVMAKPSALPARW